MKKHLILAAVVGVLAFAGVSTLVQANEPAPAAPAVEAPAAAAPAEMDAAAKIQADCEVAAAAKKADGTEPTAEEKAEAVKKCVEEKTAPAAAPAPEMPEEAPAAE